MSGKPLASIVAIMRRQRASTTAGSLSTRSAAVHLALRLALARLTPHDAFARSLLWSEATSALRDLAGRDDIEVAPQTTRSRSPGTRRSGETPHRELALDAYRLAVRLGWAKTYDAERLALTKRLACPLLTVDVLLARMADRLVGLVPPEAIGVAPEDPRVPPRLVGKPGHVHGGHLAGPPALLQDGSVFVRPRDLEPITDDLSLIMLSLMDIDAKLARIESLLRDNDDGEEETDA